jgi:hypothetical protein
VEVLTLIVFSTVNKIIGVEWNHATDTWRHIDELGNTINPDSSMFDYHPVWGSMKRVTLAAAGTENTVGANGRGDGLDLTGADGRVMVRIPKFYYKSSNPSANVYRWWISPAAASGFAVHPAFFQRGGDEQNYIYVGAYAADIEYDGADEAYNANDLKLNSRTGKQPVTGNADCIFTVSFDAGDNEPAIGDELTNGTLAGFYVVDYLKESGAWASNDAVGRLWLRKPGVSSCGWANDETITNVTQSNTVGVQNGASSGLSVTIANCRTWGGNIGAGWGIMNFWSLSAVQLLYYIEYADPDSQTTIGKGIVDKASGTGFNGELNGDDSIDTNMEANGTGTGTGTNGLTPVAYRGIENLWGNIWQFIDGYNALDAAYRLIKRDGTGTLADTLAAGSYESTTGAPITTDGYISNILYEDLTSVAFLAAAVAGLSTSYLHDYWYAHDAGETNILIAGGYWTNGVSAGVGFRNSDCVSSYVARAIGARLEFIG